MNRWSPDPKNKILVGLSGWVDSAVSAYLLREQGYDVACGFMINYLDEEHPWVCPTRADLEEAEKVAAFLDLPFYTFDYREEYEKRIVDYIYREYDVGRTPNPDVFCNNLVKFDLFLEEALSLGYHSIATGHYARIHSYYIEKGKMFPQSEQDGSQARNERSFEVPTQNFQLLKWRDPNKDQSYFLSRLTPFQLSKSIFPIGWMFKSEARELARQIGLPNAERRDSQWLCFIGKVSMKEFLEKRFPKKVGNIVDTSWKILGKHEWAFSYTIGQRRGIEVGGWPALFVIAKNTENNTITVGTEHDLLLYSQTCMLADWVGVVPEIGKIYSGKIRYRQEDQACQLKMEDWRYRVAFELTQRALSAGQISVIYDGDIVIGSGVIE